MPEEGTESPDADMMDVGSNWGTARYDVYLILSHFCIPNSVVPKGCQLRNWKNF